jgi:hypothetical protein
VAKTFDVEINASVTRSLPTRPLESQSGCIKGNRAVTTAILEIFGGVTEIWLGTISSIRELMRVLNNLFDALTHPPTTPDIE